MTGSGQEQAGYVSTHETHVGAVIVVGDRAFKLKKPVDLGFVDFRERADRLAVCRREVELNQRLAPDVYLGVADVYGPDGVVCEHLVVMRRMPAEASLAALLDAGTPVAECLRQVARLVGAFHAGAQRSPEISAEGDRDAVRGRWLGNLEGLLPYRGDLLDGDLVDEIERRALGFLAGREALFAARVEQGWIVDGHGDLLAEDIFCLDDGPRVLDCIEFDDRLRWLDALDDAACLGMDLEYRGRSDLAERFLDLHREFSGDPAPLALWHHYVAYRALVRAKVDCLQHTPGAAETAGDARRHTELAVAHLRAGTVRLVVVGGLPGTGKSTVSGLLADRLGAVLLSSDRVRKELATGDPADLYTPAQKRRTYAELTDRAAELLARGESVVLDASWTRRADRELAADAAERTHSELTELRCSAPAEVAAERLRSREPGWSDADPEVAAAMAAEADPWPQARTVPTTGTPEQAVSRALAVLQTPGDADPAGQSRGPGR